MPPRLTKTLKLLKRLLRWTCVALTAAILFYSLWTWKTPGVLYFHAADHICALGSHNGQFRLNLFYSPNSTASDFTFDRGGSHYYLSKSDPQETWAIIRADGEDYWTPFKIYDESKPGHPDIIIVTPGAILMSWDNNPLRSPHGYFYACLNFPQWFLLLPWPIYFIKIFSPRRRRAKRRRLGLCVQCGYNLKASTHRCPECGTPIPDSPPAE